MATGTANDSLDDRELTDERMSGTTEEVLAAEAAEFGEAQELNGVSAEELADAEDRASLTDANDDADAREERIETDNDTVDTLVAETQEISDEGIDTDGHDRG